MSQSGTLKLGSLIALAATAAFGVPPTTGVKWWTTNPNLDCAAYHSLAYEVSLSGGGQGYACGVTGTFIWMAAGGNWKSSILMAAPQSAAVGVQYLFYDEGGKAVSLDTLSDSAAAAGNTIGLALSANQASEVQLLGATGDPQHGKTQTGFVFALFLCPDAATCATVVPQLTYSSTSNPWLLNVPIAWDSSFSFVQPSGLATRWSAVGSQSGADFISFAIHNSSPTPAAYAVRVYDHAGALVGQGMTPVIPGGSGVDGAGGVQGFLLTDIIGSTLPAGTVKVTIEGSAPASAIFLQFSGQAAVSLPAIQDGISVSSSRPVTIP